MFLGGEFDGGGIFRSRPVNHANMLVRVADAVDVEKTRRDERARVGRSRGRPLAEQFHVESAFFLRLAQCGLFRVFVQFNVSAKRQPFVQLAMVDEQDFPVVNDEDRDGEINFFVDMGHIGKT